MTELTKTQLTQMLDDIKKVALKAGEEILRIYQKDDDISISLKDDKSPLTEADTTANDIIIAHLRENYPDYAILCEEEKDSLDRLKNPICWIVDPLDGTKEFIKKNGEFTVNIALALDHKVILGVIYAPVLDELYYAAQNMGAFLQTQAGIEELHVSSKTDDLVLVSSRSHKSDKLQKLITANKSRISSEISKGSSLKGCLIARAQADVYYRFGYTMEWDTAAMQCIIEEAGGIFRQMDDSEMLYNRENSLNAKGFYILNSTYNILHATSSNNINWHHGQITHADRLKLINQNNCAIWFTGLSGSGKSTIAVALEKELYKRGKLVFRLDGDNIRHGLNKDLGFSIKERAENLRRIIEVAKLLQEAGIIVLISFISPLQKSRLLAREILSPRGFYEIYVKAPLETCIQRDPKGLYQKALAGELKDFTGVDAEYEEPLSPELIIDTEKLDLQTSVSQIIKRLEKDHIVE